MTASPLPQKTGTRPWPLLAALAAGLLATAASWLLLQQLALQQVTDRTLDLLEQSATSAAQQSSRTRQTLHNLSLELDLPSHGPDCDAELQRTLQWVQLSSTNVRGALRVQDGVVTCSSTSALPAGTVLPRSAFRHTDGIQAWHDVLVDNMSSLGPHSVLEKHQLALLVKPGEQFNQFFRPGTPVAVYRAVPPHRAAVLPPQVPSRLLLPLPDGVEVQRERDPVSGDLVVRSLSPSSQAIVLATFPAVRLQAMATARFERSRWLAPLIGLMVMLAVLWQMRPGQRSARRELLRALHSDQLYLLYQPVIDLETGRCIGAEALMRWRQNYGGVLGPDVFVPLAEQSGLIHRLTERACQLIARELPPVLAACPTFRIGVNVSARELSGQGLVTLLSGLRSQLRLPPSQLVVELTEGSLADTEHALPTINQLRANGMAVAVDDFGTGYCSLSYLATYPFDILKIDRSFISASGTDSVIGPIAEHIVTLAKSMGVQSLAEGIETAEQAEHFRQLGVTYAQGFHFGAAMPMNQVLQLIRSAPQQ